MSQPQPDNQEINLIVEGQSFKVQKNVLCEHSDYFSAMFSGKYVEQEKKDITIDVVEASSMEIILRYFSLGLIDLSDFPLETIGTLAMAANYLQITELSKQIEYWLDLQMTVSNWLEIMAIAENASYAKLEHLARSFGLLSFKHMKAEYIPNLRKLFWYLSHPYLDAVNELEVFKFGYQWALQPDNSVCPDMLLVILSCLDLRRLTGEGVNEIANLILSSNCEFSLAAKIVECLKTLCNDSREPFTVEKLQKQAKKIQEKFTERVYNEILLLAQNSTKRLLKYTPVVAVWTNHTGDLAHGVQNYLYTFTAENGFMRWIESTDKNMWGWNMTMWGANKIVFVCGEYGRGIGRFMTDVKVYDTLRQEWIQHGVKLPPRRHAGVIVIEDSLFILGGVGAYRVIEDSTIIYDLQKRSFRKAAKFPEAIQSPAICTHQGAIYGAGHKHVYKFEDMGDKDTWKTVIETEIRPTYMISYKDHIYCSQNYFNTLYRFRPGIDTELEPVIQFNSAPVGYCNLGNHLLSFTRTTCGGSNTLRVEKYSGPCSNLHSGPQTCCIEVVWDNPESEITINDVAGACTVVLSMPKVDTAPSSYHQKYLTQFRDVAFGAQSGA